LIHVSYCLLWNPVPEEYKQMTQKCSTLYPTPRLFHKCTSGITKFALIKPRASTMRHQKKGRAGARWRGWPEIGPDGDILLMPYVPKRDNRNWWWWWNLELLNTKSSFAAVRQLQGYNRTFLGHSERVQEWDATHKTQIPLNSPSPCINCSKLNIVFTQYLCIITFIHTCTSGSEQQ
jgi:hypothetical protein